MYRLTIVLPFFLFLDLFFAVQTRKNLFSVSIIFIVVCGDFVCLFVFSGMVNFNSVAGGFRKIC